LKREETIFNLDRQFCKRRKLRMPRIFLSCLLLVTALAADGCASALNTFYFLPCEHGQRIYGGVRLDAEVFQGHLQAVREEKLTGKPSSSYTAKEATLAAVDFPFSFMLDTLTLPITVPHTLFGDKTYPLSKSDIDRVRAGSQTDPLPNLDFSCPRTRFE
jgi:uncharacterized protein YceK